MSETLAAVDVGTNSLHFVVARTTEGERFEVLTREKEMVRLGSGSTDMKELAPDAIDRAMALAEERDDYGGVGPHQAKVFTLANRPVLTSTPDVYARADADADCLGKAQQRVLEHGKLETVGDGRSDLFGLDQISLAQDREMGRERGHHRRRAARAFT